MKILFLDVDGVLNSRRTATAFNEFPWDVNPDDLRLFDNVAIGLVKKICNETDSKIILSSTWRHQEGMFEKMAKVLELPIIGRTPIKIGGNRGQEIQMWLDDHRGTVDKYAIVDDDSDMLGSQTHFFVQTCQRNGILLEHYEKLIKVLQ